MESKEIYEQFTYKKNKKEKAAIKLQALHRGYSVRKTIIIQKQQKAATAHYEHRLKSKLIKLLRQNVRERERAKALKQICMRRALKKGRGETR